MPPRADAAGPEPYDAAFYRPFPFPYAAVAPAIERRVSWGAIFAGLVVALVVELVLGTLGLAVAFGTIKPATEVQTFEGLGVGTGIWLLVTTVLALYAGGYAAGRLAGVPRRADAMLHGIVAWGLATLFSTWLVANLVGGVVSGAFGILGSTLGLVGEGVSAVAPAVGEQLRQEGITPGSFGTEISRFLEQTGDPQLQPDALRREVGEARGEAGAAAGEAAQQPGANAFDAIQAALGRLAVQGEGVVNEVDRQDAINVIVARTDLNQAEAGRVVDNWIQNWSQLRATIGTTTQQVQQNAAQVTENVSAALGSLMFWTFLAMVVGLAAAALGGAAGAPKEVPATLAVAGGGVAPIKEH
ncbi:MAG: hypothetical protein Q8P18_23880 [Pseudomonadota bacterium]|nr:hypothetical protein [Pseudomonadota bacterium]